MFLICLLSISETIALWSKHEDINIQDAYRLAVHIIEYTSFGNDYQYLFESDTVSLWMFTIYTIAFHLAGLTFKSIFNVLLQ